MARIGIDCRFASLSVGLGTYTRNIVKNLLEVSDDTFVLFVRSDDEEWLSDLSSKNYELRITNYDHYSFAEQIHFPRSIKKSKVDLLYAPHFNVPYFCPVPFVATVHDLILHRYPNHASFIKRLAYRIVISRTVRKAKSLIAVSAFTMNEIKEMYGSLVAKKTVEITEGFDSSLQETDDPDVLSFYDLKPGYFLYVGTAKQHKNVQMLIDAHAKACISTPLIVVTNGKEVETLKTHGGVRVLLGIENDELATLYSCAGCFVTASLYEGFCLPILEARACGCPVIASNTSAIPEVAGAHALLVDPTTDSLAGAFKNPPTLSDPPDKKYNWSQSAAQLADILAS